MGRAVAEEQAPERAWCLDCLYRSLARVLSERQAGTKGEMLVGRMPAGAKHCPAPLGRGPSPAQNEGGGGKGGGKDMQKRFDMILEMFSTRGGADKWLEGAFPTNKIRGGG